MHKDHYHKEKGSATKKKEEDEEPVLAEVTDIFAKQLAEQDYKKNIIIEDVWKRVKLDMHRTEAVK